MQDDLLSEDVAVARSLLKQLVVKLKVKMKGERSLGRPPA
jgi:hypothetical protein